MDADRRQALSTIVAVGIGVSTPICLQAATSDFETPEWLILYFMNGKNNLVESALDDFVEIAQVGSLQDAKVVVELGRPALRNLPSYGGWSGVKRFVVAKGMTPEEKHQEMPVGRASEPAGDMGRPETLADFISWAAQKYPAKRRMLVIWSHGQGWRFRSAKVDEPSDPNKATGGYRSVSSDVDHSSILFNKQVQSVLENSAAKGFRFDIVAYDACLMSTVETAYSLRNCADFVVGSQELEPGAGWNHTLLMEQLAESPKMSPSQVACAIVQAYKAQYGDGHTTTMAATRLAGFDQTASAISAVAKALRADAANSYPVLRKVRAQLKAFGDYRDVGFTVDAESLFERLAAASHSGVVKASALAAAKAIHSAVICNYASSQCKAYSPRGLALYFPSSNAEFLRDPDGSGYLRSNQHFPVDFVQDNDWALLLKDYLGLAA